MLISYRYPHGFLAILWLLSAMLGPNVQAHEFWIEPIRFEIAAGDLLQAHLRVGQGMKGDSLHYIPQRFETFNLTTAGTTRSVNSRTGDNPAINETVPESGLHVISYVSKDSELTHSEADKFDRFLNNEGIEWVKAAHERRGLPAQGFNEAFQRFAKSLVKVGDGVGRDRPLGLEFELVVETNPYTDQGFDVVALLLWRGRPFPRAQVTAFRRRDGEISKTRLATDAQGRVRFPRQDASGVYLLNAVHMIEPPPNDRGVVWKSLWASTTFEITQ